MHLDPMMPYPVGAILRILGDNWRDSIYAGTLLSQIGEFSFVLAAVEVQAHINSDYGYQMTVAVISISLLISPPWIMAIKLILKRSENTLYSSLPSS